MSEFDVKVVNVLYYRGASKPVQIALALSKLKLSFDKPIQTISGKVKVIPVYYIIECKATSFTVKGCEKECIVLTCFYPSKKSGHFFDEIQLSFSLDEESAQEATFVSNHDLCLTVNQYLIPADSVDQKPYLLLVNPTSGSKNGKKIYDECIDRVFKMYSIKTELLLTDRPLHAFSYIKAHEDLLKYRGIVVVSGDGLLYEVFCGISERSTWATDIRDVPIGVIAAGSGNALASSISASCGIYPTGNITLFTTLLLKSPLLQPIDLMKVQTVDRKPFPSFLSITWGLIANIDIGSDKYRWMGASRFDFSAVVEITKCSKFKGKLWYLPLSANDNEEFSKETKESGSSNESFSSSAFRYLPDISKPITDARFLRIDESFAGVVASLLPYIASNAKMIPYAKMNCRKIHLLMMSADVTRFELIKLCGQIETGDHISSPFIRVIECLAFRLVPECDKCYMAADGESMSNSPIQAELMTSTANIFTGLLSDEILL